MSVTDDKNYLTKTGLVELKNELKKLKDEKRPALIKRVAKAREFGDLSENSEYHDAREELSYTEGRVQELEAVLAKAVVFDNSNGNDQVALGNVVHVDVNGKTQEYTIVGEWEANPTKKKISHQSPLGKALIGKKVGDQVEVDAPAGKIRYLIQKIK